MSTNLKDLQVNGRGKLTASARVEPGLAAKDSYAVLRLDDERNDEFWAEVFLTRPQVEAMLKRMDRGHQLLEEFSRGKLTEEQYYAAMERDE